MITTPNCQTANLPSAGPLTIFTSMLLFHRTTVARAREIMREGFADDRWSFGRDDITGRAIKMVGVWLTDRPISAEDGPAGDAVLEVGLTATPDILSSFEVSGVVEEARLWVIPAGVVNEYGSFRIHEVDPRGSWFFEAVEDEGEEVGDGGEEEQ